MLRQHVLAFAVEMDELILDPEPVKPAFHSYPKGDTFAEIAQTAARDVFLDCHRYADPVQDFSDTF